MVARFRCRNMESTAHGGGNFCFPAVKLCLRTFAFFRPVQRTSYDQPCNASCEQRRYTSRVQRSTVSRRPTGVLAWSLEGELPIDDDFSCLIVDLLDFGREFLRRVRQDD